VTVDSRDAAARSEATASKEPEAGAFRVACDRVRELRRPLGEPGQDARELGGGARRYRGSGGVDVASESLRERLVRRKRLLQEATEEHRPAGRMSLSSELGDEAALAASRLAGHARDGELPRRRSPPGCTQGVELRASAEEGHRVGARERRRQRHPDRAGHRRHRAGARLAAHRVDQRDRLRRRLGPKVDPDALAELAEGRERARAVTSRCKAADQLAVPRFPQRLELDPAARPADGRLEVALALGDRGEALDQIGQAPLVEAPGVDRPVVVEVRQERSLGQLDRFPQPTGPVELVERGGIHPEVRPRPQADPLAGRDQVDGRFPAELAPEGRERRAQAPPGALLQHVGPEEAGDPRAGVEAGVEREPGEERPGAPAPRRVERVAVQLERQLSEAEDAEHRHRLRRRPACPHAGSPGWGSRTKPGRAYHAPRVGASAVPQPSPEGPS
jgi:hypothetical protein